MDWSEHFNQWVEDYLLLPDPRERMEAVARWGEGAPAINEADCAEKLLVPGCVSRVWLGGGVEGGLCRFRLAADSAMVRGLAGVSVRLVDGQPADVVSMASLRWPEALALDRQLTPTRLRGLAAVADRLRDLASAPL